MKYLWDTDICIHFLNGDRKILQKIQARRRQILDEIKAQSDELKKYSLKDPAKIIREERER